ncbi:hypothetical protein V1T76_06895 [Roseibium sp. FZY0029]|uniref:hypothetical protein n=1 Tax=Roseibium sp. FZY0029 TaxID=3116647 RepID=UPI002EB22D6E|nr:hypothetical protein [Roseibium sp. FZY0029]
MYNWIETTFNVSGGITQAIAVILALAVVLLLFGLFIFILKRLMGASAPQSRNRQPRIAIMDSATVDARRRLLLIRRDNIEHLILVGGPSDVVVEQNIVRNTPLTQARPGHHAPAPSGMPMPVKAALAPGPEIPARPDELLPDEEVAAPAVQARAPVQSPEPAPQPAAAVSPAPAPASTPVAPAYKAPSAAAATPSAPTTPPAAPPPAAPTRSYAEPTVARPMAARAVEPAPAPSAATAAAPSAQQPTAPKASAAVSSTVGGGLSRASDLLRAATQNGFNRAMPKAAEPVPPVQEVQAPQSASEPKVDITATLETDIQPSEPAAAMAKAPEVRPAVSAASAPQESRAASTLKSLARPFTARDRPSYGGTISPPASGPAARAKTALLKPVEPLQTDHKVEPVLAAATVAVASPQPSEESKAPSEENTPTPDQSTFAAPQPEEPAGANDQTASEQQASDALSLTEEAEAVEASADKEEDTAQTAAPTVENGASSVAQSAEGDGPSREITLDIGDLLEDVPEPSAPAPAQSPDPAPASVQAQAQAETSGTPEPQSEEPSAETSEDSQEKTTTVTVTSAATVAPAAPVSSTPVMTSAPPVKAPVRPSAGLGDRNPIEEEMAKILDELGGQSNG